MPTILCVDDEPTQLTLLKFAFRRAGFDVLLANDGREAVEIVQTSIPDVILMDLMMPVKDGATATAEIKALPGGADIPIVLFTAYERGELADRALAAGAQEIVKKTTPPTELVKKIQSMLP